MKPLLISRTADKTKKIAPLHSPLPTHGTATVTILVGTRKRRRQLFSWPLQSRLWVIRVVSDISATFQVGLGTVINDLMSGQYSDSVRVFAFDTGEHWPEDASEDVAREIMRRLDLAGDALPSSIAAFVDRHLGPDCQLTLRLA
jgi:hypothetical protein